MRIISWNVNGLRATHKQGYFEPLFKQRPDILCLQETKAEPDQLPGEVREVSGYRSYFNFSRAKKGYSGTAIYTKLKPQHVNYELGNEALDREGRLVEVRLPYRDKKAAFFSVYFPNGGQDNKRVPFKLDFYDAFLKYIEELRGEGYAIVIAGDVNTAHEEIDLARPRENEENTGFLPEERAWLDELVRTGYVDSFRHFYPAKKGAYSYWDMKTAARERNVGWRLDYIFTSPDLVPHYKKAAILADIYGSDHCPVLLELS